MPPPALASDTCTLLLSPQGVVLQASPAVERLLGLAPDELIETALAQWLPPGPAPAWLPPGDPAAAAETFALALRTSAGGWRECDAWIRPAAGASAWVLYCRARPDPGPWWQAAASAAATAWLLADAASHCVLASNPAARAWLGRERLEGAAVSELLPVAPARLAHALAEAAVQPRVPLGRCQFPRGADAAVHVADVTLVQLKSSHGDLLGVRIADAAPVQDLEQKLMRGEGLQALGRMAGGIAHDFQNLLGVILGYAEFLQAGASGSEAEDALREIQLAAERGAAATRRLLALTRAQAPEMQTVQLNRLIEGLSGLLGRMLGRNIAFEVRLEPGLAPILADPAQLELALVNLALNARDAMPRGGRFSLTTANLAAQRSAAAASGPASTAYVLLEAADSGLGMTPEVQAHMFEPFFTTKGEAGTGLGLVAVHATVEQCGGSIQVESQPGAGTRFRLRFPAAPLPAPATAAPLTATILLVEPDPALRPLLARTLREAGATVLEAEDLRQAGEQAARSPVLPDLLIVDDAGEAIGDRAAALLPEMAVLVMGLDRRASDPGSSPDPGFLAKPFGPQTLLARVEALLSARVRPQPAAPAPLRR